MRKPSSSKGSRIDRPAGIVPALQKGAQERRATQKKLTSVETPAGRRNDLLPDLHIEYIPVGDLQAAHRRTRKIDLVQSAKLDRSIAQFGICLPIVIGAGRRVIHGHGVWEAARRAGLDRVPTICADHLSPEEQRLLPIALNRLGETGTWDEVALAEELGELGEDVLVTGFELAEIDALLLDDVASSEDEDELPELEGHGVSRPGDLWRLGNHLLLHGDALDPVSYVRLFTDDEQARLVLTDEPYNVKIVGNVTGKKHHSEFAVASGELSREEFCAFNSTWMDHAARSLVDGGLLGTFIDWRSVEIVLASARDLGFELLNLVVWEKTNGGQGSLWRSQHELLPMFKVGSAKHVNNVHLGRFGRWRSNVWTYPGGSSVGSEAQAHSRNHPTVKPRTMLEDALLDITDRGEIVLDPFLGSGSTLLAAEATGRRCRAIEIDRGYCDLAIARWQGLTGSDAILSETGETFAEIAARRAATGGDEEAIDDPEA